MLVYNQSRSISFQNNLTPEISTLLDGRAKAYFDADITDSLLVVNHEVEAQNW
jgi:hypothetical protein